MQPPPSKYQQISDTKERWLLRRRLVPWLSRDIKQSRASSEWSSDQAQFLLSWPQLQTLWHTTYPWGNQYPYTPHTVHNMGCYSDVTLKPTSFYSHKTNRQRLQKHSQSKILSVTRCKTNLRFWGSPASIERKLPPTRTSIHPCLVNACNSRFL